MHKGLFTLSALKAYPSLIPLVVVTGLGVVACVTFSMRSMAYDPDIQLKKNNAYEDYRDKQFKLYATEKEYYGIQSQAPKF